MAVNKYLDYAGLQELVTKIGEKYGISSAFTFKGTVATISGLPTVSGASIGDVYNVTTGGTTTSDFVEGAGKDLQDGENVVAVNTGTTQVPVMKWDILGGVFKITDRLQFGSTMPANPTSGQTFLYLGNTTYKYTAVANPTGDPQAQGWYEYDSTTEQYTLTEDTEVQSGTTYFTKDEEYVKGVIYVYSGSAWVAQTAGDTFTPITNQEIDALFE